MRGFINGIVFLAVLLVAGGLTAVWLGLVPARADEPPGALEKWAARTSLRATIDRDIAGMNVPIEPTEANLQDGVRLYAANCAVCHGAADGKPSILAQGFGVKAPQLAKDGVEDDPAQETFWKLDHGIRFTAMPAFGTRIADDDLWKIALFLKQMDKLPPSVDALWKRVPSAAASPAPL